MIECLPSIHEVLGSSSTHHTETTSALTVDPRLGPGKKKCLGEVTHDLCLSEGTKLYSMDFPREDIVDEGNNLKKEG